MSQYVTLRTDLPNGRQFRVNRVVLGEVSNYFNALLRWNTEKNDITLQGITEEMLVILIGM